MTGRDWQPGDVLVSNGERGIVAIEPFNGRLYVEMASGRCRLADELAPDAHLLAAIDPEDREQVERLMRVVRDRAFCAGTYPGMGKFADAMQAALREFINPKPRIEEPQGLGAVVEDTQGDTWVHVPDPTHSWVRINRPEGAYTNRAKWDRIDVSKVLSEGVQP